MGTAVSWSSVLHHRPHSIILAGLTEPCPVCHTGVRPQAAELSAYVEREEMKRLQQKAGHGGGNEGPRQPLLVSPCLVVATDIPRSPETVKVQYLLGRSQSAPPTSTACRSSYPHPPCPVGRSGGGVVVLIRAGPWTRSYGQSLCLIPQGQAGVARQLPQGSPEVSSSSDLA